MLARAKITEIEALGISNIFWKLMMFFPPFLMLLLPENLLVQLVDHLTSLTCSFTKGAASEESYEKEEQLYMEAFEQMLQSWACLLKDGNIIGDSPRPQEHIKQSATQIFDTYLQSHLSAPEGTRQSVSIYFSSLSFINF